MYDKIKEDVEGVNMMHVEGQHQNIGEAWCVLVHEKVVHRMVVRDEVIENRKNMGI